MELFTLLANPAVIDAERLASELKKALHGVHIKSDALICRVVPLPGGTGIVGDLSIGRNEDALAAVIRKQAAAIIARELIAAYEETFVARCIAKEVGAEDNGDGIAAIQEHCGRLLELPANNTDAENLKAQGFPIKRLDKLAGQIEEFLREQTFLHLEGFWDFRTAAYREEVKDTVSYAVDEWRLEQQYQEFISLLKYFVYIQESKIPEAHVIHHGNYEFSVYDEQMLPIQAKQTEQFVVELIDKDINYEDMIVSTLISVSPAKLLIHTQTPEIQVISTILTIFEDRAEVCLNCPVCDSMLEKRSREINPT